MTDTTTPNREPAQPLGLGCNEQLGAWQPIETARWLTDEQAAETDADGVGFEGGWYECINNWDDYTEVAIHEGEPSHWMPLPAPPVSA